MYVTVNVADDIVVCSSSLRLADRRQVGAATPKTRRLGHSAVGWFSDVADVQADVGQALRTLVALDVVRCRRVVVGSRRRRCRRRRPVERPHASTPSERLRLGTGGRPRTSAHRQAADAPGERPIWKLIRFFAVLRRRSQRTHTSGGRLRGVATDAQSPRRVDARCPHGDRRPRHCARRHGVVPSANSFGRLHLAGSQSATAYRAARTTGVVHPVSRGRAAVSRSRHRHQLLTLGV